MEGNTSNNITGGGNDYPRLALQNPVGSPVMVAAKIVVGSIGVVGNLLVVSVFMKYKKLFQNIKTTFIVNQSVIDGIVSLLLILTTFVSPELHRGVDGLLVELYCKLWLSQVPIWGLMTSSTYNLMAISTERYLAIVHPIWHKVTFTKKMADSVAICIWLFGVSFVASIVIPTTGMMRGHCFASIFWASRATARAVAFVQIFVNMILPIFVHSFCYARILSALRKRKRMVTPEDGTTSTAQMRMTSGTNARPTPKAGDGHVVDESNTTRASVSFPSTSNTTSASLSFPSTSNTITTTSWKSNASTDHASRSSDKRPNPLVTQNEKAKLNIVKTLAIITGCYFICWVPNKILVLLYSTGTIATFPRIFGFTVILAFINCCINPIIYIGKYDAFRTGLSLLFRSCR